MTEPVDIYVYDSVLKAEPIYLDQLIVNSLIAVYVDEGLVSEVTLPLYNNAFTASAAGLLKGDLYFNLEGKLNIMGRQTSLIANLSKAVSYLRRLF